MVLDPRFDGQSVFHFLLFLLFSICFLHSSSISKHNSDFCFILNSHHMSHPPQARQAASCTGVSKTACAARSSLHCWSKCYCSNSTTHTHTHTHSAFWTEFWEEPKDKPHQFLPAALRGGEESKISPLPFSADSRHRQMKLPTKGNNEDYVVLTRISFARLMCERESLAWSSICCALSVWNSMEIQSQGCGL